MPALEYSRALPPRRPQVTTCDDEVLHDGGKYVIELVPKPDDSASCGQVDPVFRIERCAHSRESLARKPADEIRAKAHDVPAHNQNPQKRCHGARADHQR